MERFVFRQWTLLVLAAGFSGGCNRAENQPKPLPPIQPPPIAAEQPKPKPFEPPPDQRMSERRWMTYNHFLGLVKWYEHAETFCDLIIKDAAESKLRDDLSALATELETLPKSTSDESRLVQTKAEQVLDGLKSSCESTLKSRKLEEEYNRLVDKLDEKTRAANNLPEFKKDKNSTRELKALMIEIRMSLKIPIKKAIEETPYPPTGNEKLPMP